MRLRALLAIVLLFVALSAGGAGAAESQAERPPQWAYGLAHDLMSPFCPGRTLAECPSPQADELRIFILTQAAAGATRQEIVDGLLARFGDQIRQVPKAEGWGMTAYALPILLLLIGAPLAAFALSRLTRGGGSGGGVPAGAASATASAGAGRLDDAVGGLEREVDRELAQLD